MGTYEYKVDVELHELLDWGSQYEYFVDLLRDKIVLDNDEIPEDLIIIQQYAMIEVPKRNTVTFEILYEVETW